MGGSEAQEYTIPQTTRIAPELRHNSSPACRWSKWKIPIDVKKTTHGLSKCWETTDLSQCFLQKSSKLGLMIGKGQPLHGKTTICQPRGDPFCVKGLPHIVSSFHYHEGSCPLGIWPGLPSVWRLRQHLQPFIISQVGISETHLSKVLIWGPEVTKWERWKTCREAMLSMQVEHNGASISMDWRHISYQRPPSAVQCNRSSLSCIINFPVS